MQPGVWCKASTAADQAEWWIASRLEGIVFKHQTTLDTVPMKGHIKSSLWNICFRYLKSDRAQLSSRCNKSGNATSLFHHFGGGSPSSIHRECKSALKCFLFLLASLTHFMNIVFSTEMNLTGIVISAPNGPSYFRGGVDSYIVIAKLFTNENCKVTLVRHKTKVRSTQNPGQKLWKIFNQGFLNVWTSWET